VRGENQAQVLVDGNAQGKSLGQGTGEFRLMDFGGWVRLQGTVRNARVADASYESFLGASARSATRVAPGGDKPASAHLVLSGKGVVFRNLKIRPLGLKGLPFVRGKETLGEWKVLPGKKSQFTVTEEGWLHVKDGPGDLQSRDQWGDFVLQLECKTNGPKLNSGIFFRCRPDEYQQGYEAQIHNGFLPAADKEYTLEVYDPQTHELKETKKVKYAAVDYGTGAIYRRMPARKQMAEDGEWFTMTVAAHGRHMAVWVNGIQVTDWTDNRPLKDNARNGCRLEKGAISLQGHDPTTDIDFRNLRLAELPKAK